MEWIPVEEGLPDAYKDVLFFLKAVKGNGLIRDTILKDHTIHVGNKPRLKDDRATHWMPLPKPPSK